MSLPLRTDYAFPFRISAAGRGAQAAYAQHVSDMVRQVLLTAPGERVDLPDFGCGLRRLLFAPDRTGAPLPTGIAGIPTDAATAAAQIVVRQALDRWLAGVIEVKQVTVLAGDDAPEGVLEIDVLYLLLETQDTATTRVRVLR